MQGLKNMIKMSRIYAISVNQIFIVISQKFFKKSRQTQEIVKFQSANFPADKEEM